MMSNIRKLIFLLFLTIIIIFVYREYSIKHCYRELETVPCEYTAYNENSQKYCVFTNGSAIYHYYGGDNEMIGFIEKTIDDNTITIECYKKFYAVRLDGNNKNYGCTLNLDMIPKDNGYFRFSANSNNSDMWGRIISTVSEDDIFKLIEFFNSVIKK